MKYGTDSVLYPDPFFDSVDLSSSIAAAPCHKCSACRDVSSAQPDIFALGRSAVDFLLILLVVTTLSAYKA